MSYKALHRTWTAALRARSFLPGTTPEARDSIRRYVLLLIAAILSASFLGCASSAKFPREEYRMIGAYVLQKHKTVYAFREREEAERVAEKITESGRTAVIADDEVKGKKIYRIFVRRDEDKPAQLVWPEPPQKARIEYLGTLGINKSKKKRLTAILFGDSPDSPEKKSFLTYPAGVAMDGSGRAYVCNRGGVEIFDSETDAPRSFLPRGFPFPQEPMDVAISSDGRVFVSDAHVKRVLVYRGNTLLSVIGEKAKFEKPCGLAIDDKRGRLYVTDLKRNSVFAFALDGELLFTIDSRADGPHGSQFGAPTDLAVSSNGTLYVIDQGGAKVNMYSPDGEFMKTFGGCHGAPGYFVRPKGIAIDSGDHVYVTDTVFNNFQVFSSDGRLLLVVGSDGSEPGRFRIPFFMHIDSRDHIYVSDLGTNRVEIFRYLGDTEETADAALEDQ